jgi:hypothetical protein
MEVFDCVAAFRSLDVCLLVWCQIPDITRSRIVTHANYFGYFSRAVAICCQISDNFAPVLECGCSRQAGLLPIHRRLTRALKQQAFANCGIFLVTLRSERARVGLDGSAREPSNDFFPPPPFAFDDIRSARANPARLEPAITCSHLPPTGIPPPAQEAPWSAPLDSRRRLAFRGFSCSPPITELDSNEAL